MIRVSIQESGFINRQFKLEQNPNSIVRNSILEQILITDKIFYVCPLFGYSRKQLSLSRKRQSLDMAFNTKSSLREGRKRLCKSGKLRRCMLLSGSGNSTYIYLLPKLHSSIIRDVTMCIRISNIYIEHGRSITSSSPSRHTFRYIYRWLTCTLEDDDLENRPARHVARHQFSDTHDQHRRESNIDYQTGSSVDTLASSWHNVAPPPYVSPNT